MFYTVLVLYVVFVVLYEFAIISLRKREVVVLLELSSCCLVDVVVMCLFLRVQCVGLV